MSDAALEKLAEAAGLLVHWTDINGCSQQVRPDTLRAVLRALEIPTGSPADIAEQRKVIRRRAFSRPPLAVMQLGELLRIPNCRKAELVLDSGERIQLATVNYNPSRRLHIRPGYYQLDCDGKMHRIAIAPRQCFGLHDVAPGRRLSGISVQIYSLRGGTTADFGDFGALANFADEAGRLGFDALMASPVHALFGAEPGRFMPYSPSTRLFLNPLFADVSVAGGPSERSMKQTNALINWQRAGAAKYARLRRAFEQFQTQSNRDEFDSFCRRGGERMLAHALFEALDLEFRAKGTVGFRNWPRGFESPRAPGVRHFARKVRREVEYQLFLQWLAAASAARAQEMARGRMAIGIIADVAVGMDPNGSHAWSAPDELLHNVHVGAPPDMFNPDGQDWGLTTLSPRALEQSGFDAYIATLRAAMRHAGGVRIDHVMGMRRLWVIPAGATPAEGVYLRYPERELLGLLALESHMHRAIVIGEDLGTVPDGFRKAIASAGVLGTQVLWFERGLRGEYRSPGAWSRNSVATTTTHDLPTVAGWWNGRDIKIRQRADCLGGDVNSLREKRTADRKKLWSAFRRAGCAGNQAPSPDKPDPAVAAALRFVAGTRSPLAVAPLEDIAADPNQPNLPGTTDGHSNWRRRVKNQNILRTKSSRLRATAFVTTRRSC